MIELSMLSFLLISTVGAIVFLIFGYLICLYVNREYIRARKQKEQEDQ